MTTETEQATAEQPLVEFASANADAAVTLEYTRKMLDVLETSPLPAMIIDIDGVVLNNAHRLHHIVCTDAEGNQQPRVDADWVEFHKAAHLDTPGDYAPLVKELIIQGVYAPVFLTARVEIWDTTRSRLADQLHQALGFPVPLFSIIMRERQSSFTAHTFKNHITSLMLSRGVKVGMAIDDSHVNCLEFKALGIPTLRAYNHLREDALLY